VLAAKVHPLAQKDELTVAEVLDETFSGVSPSLEPVRAGFWRLDDHRDAPGGATVGQASNAQEMLALIASGAAITTASASSATTVQSAVPGVVAIPLRDAHPTVLSLVWHKANPNPLVDEIVATARTLGDSDGFPEGRPRNALASGGAGRGRP
jgi:DNA-binding transcriptional LysR family regulator